VVTSGHIIFFIIIERLFVVVDWGADPASCIFYEQF